MMIGPKSTRSAIVACLILAAATGCASVKARETHFKNRVRDFRERREAAEATSIASGKLLAREGLADLADEDSAAAATALEDRLANRPQAGGALALAELSLRAGLERQPSDPQLAASWYRDAATLAAIAAGESTGTSGAVAIEVHNRSVARLIRISQAEGKKRDGGWQKVLVDRGLALASPSPDLAPARFADFMMAEDIRVTGMQHVYRSAGLGVPLIVHRTVEATTSPDPLDRFHPRELRSAATAVVTPGGGLADRAWRRNPATLALFDPFLDHAVRFGSNEIPLAGDRTTPLAVQVAEGTIPTLELTGLFDSEFRRKGVEAGLYMLRPYEPGKIPVVLVHGLFSSPRAFLQTINELQNDAEIAARYQFWVFLYPTGKLIPASSREFRTSLLKVRASLDPTNADPAMDRMVLIGHSMGGLLSKMMVQDSGLTLWDAAFSLSPDQLKAGPAIREILDSSLIYRPLPFIRRVVFIATPHRGSPIADQWFGRTIAKLIRRTSESTKINDELTALNGPDLVTPEFKNAPLNAVSNLRTNSPILKALDEIPIDPTVPYHSIIPLLGSTLPTDGVVEYQSSHLDGVLSEKVVSGTHFAQQHAEVTEEIRRILRLHITEP